MFALVNTAIENYARERIAELFDFNIDMYGENTGQCEPSSVFDPYIVFKYIPSVQERQSNCYIFHRGFFDIKYIFPKDGKGTARQSITAQNIRNLFRGVKRIRLVDSNNEIIGRINIEDEILESQIEDFSKTAWSITITVQWNYYECVGGDNAPIQDIFI